MRNWVSIVVFRGLSDEMKSELLFDNKNKGNWSSNIVSFDKWHERRMKEADIELVFEDDRPLDWISDFVKRNSVSPEDISIQFLLFTRSFDSALAPRNVTALIRDLEIQSVSFSFRT